MCREIRPFGYGPHPGRPNWWQGVTGVHLADKPAAFLWRMLVPPQAVVCAHDLDDDELIFLWRDWVVYVQPDGAVLRIPRPAKASPWWTAADWWDLLWWAADSVDYDALGVYAMGEIIRDLGLVVPVRRRGEPPADVSVRLIRHDGAHVETLLFRQVSPAYALYRGLLRCADLDAATDGEWEHHVQRLQVSSDVVPFRH
ncbi:hypothetical protein JCM14719A_11080 [Calditerricola satsumensis]|uniref:Uncharacterized protein n=1 Tax=Calditerricola satsumensis TaxID=373054 RepID=A0A8J3BCZ6_9BACI|nr:hypothetical protein [Calditerricola satsumensis]GGJ99110.1 hypothetical protein GCM10007043_11470 [Calditerricola satsumensis]